MFCLWCGWCFLVLLLARPVESASPTPAPQPGLALSPSTSTFAGTGSTTFTPAGRSPDTTAIAYPGGIAYDPCTSTLFYSDRIAHRVRSIFNGVVSDVAGTGFAGSSGDGGLASLATMNYPDGLMVAPDGSLLVAEYFGNRVRA